MPDQDDGLIRVVEAGGVTVARDPARISPAYAAALRTLAAQQVAHRAACRASNA